MKLLIVLSVIACSYAAKLDRTYLPPTNAGSSGGSPGSLNTPLGPSGFGQPAGFGQAGAKTGFGQAEANTGFGQAGANAGFGQSGANTGFGKPGANAEFGAGNNGFSSSKYTQPGQAVGPNFDAGFGAPAQNFGNQDYQRSQPQRAQSSSDQNAQILRSDSQNDGESFSYNFETSNGISAEESGVATNGVQAQGAFAYSSDDGQTFRVQHTADENGYQPQGDHLPTSPPIPDEILKSIEENARAAASGTQEGAYNPEEDNDVSHQQYSNNAPTSYNRASGSQAGPAQLYGAPNPGSRSQNPQTYSQSQQFQTQQYNAAQNSGSSLPSNAFSQQSQTPSQLYGSSSNARPNSFDQRPSKYSSGSANFESTGPQARPQQYQVSSQFSSGRQESAQDASGYQYNKPQGFGNANAQQYQPQNGAAAGLQGFSRPNGNAFPSNSNAQSVGASPNSQTFGSAPASNSQSSFSSGPSSFGSNAQTSYSAPSTGSFAPNGFNKPQGNTFRSQAQSAQSMSGYEYNRPQNRGSSQSTSQFGGSQSGSSQFRGSSQSSSPQFSGPSQSNGSSQFKGSLNSNVQSGTNSGAGFGAARAPPSFSEEEGYKY